MAWVLPVPWPKSDHLDTMGGPPSSTDVLWFPGLLQSGGANVVNGPREAERVPGLWGWKRACTILPSSGVEEGVVTEEGVSLA